MRAFISIDIPDEIKTSIIELQHNIPKQLRISTVGIEKLHITMMFFPNLDDKEISYLSSNFSSFRFNKFNISLAGVGLFTPKVPRVLYIKVLSDDNRLYKLYEEIHSAVSAGNIKFDDKRFVPHLTIGRIKSHVNRIKFLDAIRQFEDYKFGSFTCNEFKIKESVFTATSTEYHDLFTKKLD